MSLNTTEYIQDGDEAMEIAKSIPYFPFKGIPRFYDIGGFLSKPTVFARIVEIFCRRYKGMNIDVIAGIDSRGFVLGTPIALALQKPFVMIRKPGKMPNCVSSSAYSCEYGHRSGMCLQRDVVKEGDRVLIIDDLVATGGTLTAAIECVHLLGGVVVECACVVKLKMFAGKDNATDGGCTDVLPNRTKLFERLGIGSIPVWGLISEEILEVVADLPIGYVDDGVEH